MKIFVSYSSKDKDIASRIATKLSNNHVVFFDQHSLRGGEDFWARIRKEIKSCDLFVFLISENSTNSKSFALRELRHARSFYSVRTNIRVLPVYLPGQKKCALPKNIAKLHCEPLASNSDGDIASLDTKVSQIATSRTRFRLNGMDKVAALGIAAILAACILCFFGNRQSTVRDVTLYTGQEGSTYNYLGVHLKNALEESGVGEKYTIKLEPTPGSVQNCLQVVSIPMEPAHKNSDTSIKLALFQLAAHQNTRKCSPGRVVYLAPLYDEVTHIIVGNQAFKSLSRKNRDISLCELIAKNKISIANGLDGSSTRMVADELTEQCKDKIQKLLSCSFNEALGALKSNEVDLAFFNQATRSQLINRAVTDNSACILSLSESDIDMLQKDLKLERYESPDAADTFFSSHLCGFEEAGRHIAKRDPARKYSIGNTPRFKSVSSISVLAVSADDENSLDPDLVKSILRTIYGDKQEEIKKVAPDIFNCEKVKALLNEGENLIGHGGDDNVSMHKVAKDYFNNGCTD